jgi:8-oxo-dGTP pyrophosphatase MutT (NUDIX family)
MTKHRDFLDWRTALSGAEVTIPFTLIACENAEGELLMLKRTKPPFVDMWNFVGGKIEPHELPHASALRELLEELGRSVAPRLLKYRGVAFWPETGGHEVHYKGMHLFYAKLPAKAHLTGQFALLDEGVTAWLPKALLAEGNEFPAVPNFDVLYPVMVEAQEDAPRAVFHWPAREGGYESASGPIRCEYAHPSSFPPGTAKVAISALTALPR